MKDSAKLEALLYVSPKGLKCKKICEIMEINDNQLKSAIDDLKEQLTQRGIELVCDDELLILATKKHHAKLIDKLHKKGGPSLSQPMLETLAIIAYKQPIEKTEIDTIRGVDSLYTIKSLLDRDLIKKIKDAGYTTTKDFLLHLGITSIDQLPPLENKSG